MKKKMTRSKGQVEGNVQKGRFADNLPVSQQKRYQPAEPVRHEDASIPVQRLAGLKSENVALTTSNYESKGVTPNTHVEPLIEDGVKRVFKNAGEMNQYTAGSTDYIGDVKNKWVRMDPAKFYVLGETHGNPDGTAPDVIKGVRTKRFMYEPFHDITGFGDRNEIVRTWDFDGTKEELSDLSKQDSLGEEAGELSPSLENMVFKIGVGFTFVKQFAKSHRLLRNHWKYDAEEEYSFSERGAHYLRFAILICRDLLAWDVAEGSATDRWRKLYLSKRGLFDTMVLRRGNNTKIWLYEMAPDHEPSTLEALWAFADLGYDWVAVYTRLLAAKTKDKKMAKIGEKMQRAKDADPLDDEHPLNQARELYMAQKLAGGKGTYLIAGMGDAHRESLEKTHGSLADEWWETEDFIDEQGRESRGDYDSLG